MLSDSPEMSLIHSEQDEQLKQSTTVYMSAASHLSTLEPGEQTFPNAQATDTYDTYSTDWSNMGASNKRLWSTELSYVPNSATVNVTTDPLSLGTFANQTLSRDTEGIKLIWIIFVIVIFLMLVLNVLMFATVTCQTRLHHMTYYFVTSLSVLHILTALTVMPVAMLIAMHGEFPLSAGVCRLWVSADLFVCNNTCLHVAFASMDAYLRLKEPLRHRGRGPLCTCSHVTWLSAPWLISLVQAGAQWLLSAADTPILQNGLCFIASGNFLLVGALFSYALPNIITVSFMGLVRREVKALKAGLYLDENGSVRRDYQCDSENSSSDHEVDPDEADKFETAPPSEIVLLYDVTPRHHVNLSCVETSDTDKYEDELTVTTFTADVTNNQTNTNAGESGSSNGAISLPNSPKVHAQLNNGQRQVAFINRACSDLDLSDEKDTTVLITDPASISQTPAQIAAESPYTAQQPSHMHKSGQTEPLDKLIQAPAPCEEAPCPDACLRQELAVCRLLFALVAAELLLWAPLSVSQLVYTVCAHCHVTMTSQLLLSCTGYLYALVQPLLCCVYSEASVFGNIRTRNMEA